MSRKNNKNVCPSSPAIHSFRCVTLELKSWIFFLSSHVMSSACKLEGTLTTTCSQYGCCVYQRCSLHPLLAAKSGFSIFKLAVLTGLCSVYLLTCYVAFTPNQLEANNANNSNNSGGVCLAFHERNSNVTSFSAPNSNFRVKWNASFHTNA